MTPASPTARVDIAAQPNPWREVESLAPRTEGTFVPWARLAERFSVGPKHLGLPAPSPEQMFAAAGLALRAPDHAGLAPFRFVQILSEQRATLGGLFAQDAARRGHAAEEVERARERAFNGPALLALVARVRDDVDAVPPHEQWICVGGGLMNFLNALHLQGFAAKTLSGASVRSAEIQQAFCASGETLVAWVVAGTALRKPQAKRRQYAASILSDWRP